MLKPNEIQLAIEECANDHLELLRRCGGYYSCPKDSEGIRLGPLVAYRGEYEHGKRFVGDVYVNFAKAEQYPLVVRHFASCLLGLLSEWADGIDVFCGAPEGGKCLADKLAMITQRGYVYPEKKDGKLVWGRHSVESGQRVAIVEDVSNNFSTTDLMLGLIEQVGGTPVVITTFLNRSPSVDDTYAPEGGASLPVIALVRKKIMEYRQDDSDVASDIASGNIVWKVKDEWSRLEQAMQEASA